MALTKVKGSGLATGAATDNLVGIDDNATSTAITIDASENVGIGIVPIAGQHSAGTSLQLSSQGLIQGFDSNSNEQLWVGCNNYYSSASTNKYIETDAASRLAFDNAGNMTFYVAPSGTAGNAISWTTAMTIANGGNVTVNTGNLVIGTSGKGIDFSAVSDGTRSVSSNLLDDYEEGTWTGTLQGTVHPTTTQSIPGHYVKIGSMVTVTCEVWSLDATGASGAVKIAGLPFPQYNGASSGAAHGTTSLSRNILSQSSGNSDAMPRLPNGSTTVTFYANNLNNTAYVSVPFKGGNMSNGLIGFNLTYRTT